MTLPANVRRFRQPRDSQLCGPSCLAFVDSLRGVGTTPRDVARELTISKTFGIGLFDLALHPLRHGLHVDLFASDAAHFPVGWFGKPGARARNAGATGTSAAGTFGRDTRGCDTEGVERAVLRDLETKRPRPRAGSWMASLRTCLELGAGFRTTPITATEFARRRRRGEHLILYVNSALLYHHADGLWGHYVVPLETKGRSWTIFDPHWKYGGVKTYTEDDLLFAAWSVGSYGMFLKDARASIASGTGNIGLPHRGGVESG